IAGYFEIGAPGLGNEQALPLAPEQLQAELRLERLDLLTDRALRDAQLLRRLGEAQVPCRGLESPDGIERRQAARHGLNTSLEKLLIGTAKMVCRQGRGPLFHCNRAIGPISSLLPTVGKMETFGPLAWPPGHPRGPIE